MYHAMVTATHLSQFPCPIHIKMFQYIIHKTLDNSDVHRSFHEMAPRFLENFGPFTCTMSIHVVLCILLLNSFSNSPAHWRAVLYVLRSCDSHLTRFSQVLGDEILHLLQSYTNIEYVRLVAFLSWHIIQWESLLVPVELAIPLPVLVKSETLQISCLVCTESAY